MAKHGKLFSTLKNTRRVAEVIGVLIRYGFHEFVADSGLDRFGGDGESRKSGTQGMGGESHRHLSAQVRLRLLLEELGPTFIKLGQVLSTRPDIIPQDIAEEFKKLQNDCPKVPTEKIMGILNEEFQDKTMEIFSFIDPEPLAAASVAQTHRARLKDGTEVVIKVLRPGIHETVESDMAVLEDIARIVESRFNAVGYSASKLVDEFSKQLKKELNLKLEGKSTERLGNFFRDDEKVGFPRVHWIGTTKNVLTMEEIKGTPLSEFDLTTLSFEERRSLAATGADAVFRMCLDLGFFHADPHPGNIFVMKDCGICFVDCGMTGHIDARTQEQLAELVAGVVTVNLDKVIRVTLALADTDPTLETNRSFRADAWELVSRFHVDSLENMDLLGLLQGFFELLRRYSIHCPSDLVFLIKALTTIQGVGLEIDPSFDVISHIEPGIKNLVRRRYGFGAIRSRLSKSLLSYLELAENLPGELRMLITQMRLRDFKIHLRHDGLEGLKESLERSARYISLSMILASVIISSSTLVTRQTGAFAWDAFSVIGAMTLAFAAVFAVVLIKGILKRK